MRIQGEEIRAALGDPQNSGGASPGCMDWVRRWEGTAFALPSAPVRRSGPGASWTPSPWGAAGAGAPAAEGGRGGGGRLTLEGTAEAEPLKKVLKEEPGAHPGPRKPVRAL